MSLRDAVVPEGKNPKKYTLDERRADILRILEAAGHPRRIGQKELAKRYGVTQPTIHSDIKHIYRYAKIPSHYEIEFTIWTYINRALQNAAAGSVKEQLMGAKVSIDVLKILSEVRDVNEDDKSDFSLDTVEELRKYMKKIRAPKGKKVKSSTRQGYR